MFGDDSINNMLRNLMMARNCAHVHHWQAKSLSLHLALGELYEQITEFMDELAEMYMGMSGVTVSPQQSDPNHFSEQDPLEFILQFSGALEELKSSIPQDPPLINKYEEMQGEVARIKYKMEKLA
jgi:DNA-binding ferritin-like protein